MEQAMSMIMTGGAVGPETIRFSQPRWGRRLRPKMSLRRLRPRLDLGQRFILRCNPMSYLFCRQIVVHLHPSQKSAELPK